MSSKVYTRRERHGEFMTWLRTPYRLQRLTARQPKQDASSTCPVTKAYYEQQLDDLFECEGQRGPGSCGEAEDAPLLPEDDP